MRIYNTLTRTKEEFKPLNPGKVGIYVCGPTVYDFIHIGNARPMIVFDTLRRYLEHKGYEVNYISNFTDIDDKIINRSIQEGIPASEVSEKYIAECKKDMEALNVRPATTHPQATKEIPEMIDMVNTLIENGHAYEKNGTVYFKVRSFDQYGKLSHKNIDDLESGHRAEAHALKVSGEDEKEDSLDFVLWKPKKEGEPFWVSPWGEGRPGWHLECSCMSKKYIGDTLDIHAGGEDLIFPHHENEIAQSEAASGKEFSRYWMHNAFLKINGEKMAKSLGNFFTVRDICEKYDPQVIRFFMLSAQYRTPLNFSEELIDDSSKGLDRILNGAEKLRGIIDKDNKKELSDAEKKIIEEEIPKFVEKFDSVMDDDLNTADAISTIFEYIRFTNANTDTESSSAFASALYDTLFDLSDNVLGIHLERKAVEIDDSEVNRIEELIAERTAAKKEKNFARADEIRDMLLSEGIILEDTREGVKWKKA
ncbi:MAG: cysteine--tRNA ligase [Eubacterium sp.]|nr:cysteine--tRNA ligase [Eubacterium sp.]